MASKIFRSLVSKCAHGTKGPPLQILGTVNAYAAMLAKQAGAQAIYVVSHQPAYISFHVSPPLFLAVVSLSSHTGPLLLLVSSLALVSRLLPMVCLI